MYCVEATCLHASPLQDVTARYFIPTEPRMAEVGVTSLGMFANDLAFLNLDPEEELYASLSRPRHLPPETELCVTGVECNGAHECLVNPVLPTGIS